MYAMCPKKESACFLIKDTDIGTEYLLFNLFFDIADLLIHVFESAHEGKLLLQAVKYFALYCIGNFLLGLLCLGSNHWLLGVHPVKV